MLYPTTLPGWLFFLARSLLVTLWFFVVSFLLLLIAFFRPFSYKNGILFCRWLSPMALFLLGIKIEFRNVEKATSHQPCIFIGNHQHLIDLFAYSYTLSDRTITLGKQSIRWIPIFGWLYWLSGQVLIDRSNNERAVATLLKAKERLERERLSLFIFPEGTRSRGRPLGPFKKGAFHMALSTKFNLVPVVATDYFRFLNLGKLHSGTIVMEALDPISIEGKTADQIMAESREIILKATERLNAEQATLR